MHGLRPPQLANVAGALARRLLTTLPLRHLLKVLGDALREIVTCCTFYVRTVCTLEHIHECIHGVVH
jgi:hypothetical protein